MMIAPKESAIVTLTYHPLIEGTARGEVLIKSTDVEAPELEVPMFGFAGPLLPPPPEARCPEGQEITYRRYDTPAVASGVFDPATAQPFHQLCEDHGCMGSDVAIETGIGHFVCDDAPPECGEGQGLEYAGGWRCVACDVVVQYGFIFNGLRVCAPPPNLSCQTGQVPTFDAEMRRWRCESTCDNGLYDRQTVDGDIVCVPC
jgi:hypothetical protein